MTAIGIACRRCAAQPLEPCVGLPAGTVHAERVEDAAGWGAPGEPVSVAAFDAAVLGLGVV